MPITKGEKDCSNGPDSWYLIQLDSSLTKEAQNYLLQAVMEQSIELDSEFKNVLASIGFAGTENREVDEWNEFAKFVAGKPNTN